MKIVTSGAAYLDIDAYACCIAYAELLNRQGIDARAVSGAPLNASITPTLLALDCSLDTHDPADTDEFILMDVSDPRHVDPIVPLERVVEVIDHHPGFETHWAERLGPKADIRPIGAAATQVFERWVKAGQLYRISKASATLLATAILDNTLNFTNAMTSELDAQAYLALAEVAGLSRDWPERYFLECQAAIEANLAEALQADCKRLGEANLPEVFAQLTVWDAQGLVHRQGDRMLDWLRGQGGDGLVNLIGIADGKSHFLTSSASARDKLGRLLPLCWQGEVAVTEPSLLRKQLLTLALEAR